MTALTGWEKVARYPADGTYLITLDTLEDGTVDTSSEAAQYLSSLPNPNGGRDEFSPLFNLNIALDLDTGGAWCAACYLPQDGVEAKAIGSRVSQRAYFNLCGIPRGSAPPQELV